MSVTVSVIIVNWNTRELTLDAVDSVLGQDFDGTVEVIVVDNGSADGTLEALAGRPGVRTIASPVNLGYAGGNNLGLQRARGEFTLLLNSDAILTPGALQTLVDDARAHPEAGAIGPRVVYPDGRVQYTWDYLPSLAAELWLVLVGRRRIASDAWQAEVLSWRESRPVKAISLACLMVPSKVWRRIGLLATEPFLYFEEADLTMRLLAAGYGMRLVPESKVIHREAQSTGQVPYRRRVAHYRSRLWYYETHRGKIAAGLIRFLSRARACLGLALAGPEAKDALWRPILAMARKGWRGRSV